MKADHPHPDSLQRLFAGLVEGTFITELGVCDPQLTDYISQMLADFTHVDRIYALQRVNGDSIRELSQMQTEAVVPDAGQGSRRARLLNKYIGDFTLFWSGIYPESLRPRFHGGISRFDEYVAQGKRSYGIASELSAAADHPPGSLLRVLSEQFEFCVHGLRRVRASWEELSQRPRTN